MNIPINDHPLKDEVKKTLALSLPLMASQLIYAGSSFLSTAILAHLGTNALAASVLISLPWFTLCTLVFGILGATGVLVAQQYGAKNNKVISEIMGQSYLFGAIICIPTIALLASLTFILQLLHEPLIVMALATQYLHSLLWAIPGLITVVISQQFLAAIGRAKIILHISLLVLPVEISLIYLLVFGKFWFPACEIAGVGYGFATAYTLTAVGLLIFLLRNKNYRPFHILQGFFKFNGHWLKDLLRTGLPMGFMNVIEVSTFALVTFWIAKFGTIMLAAHQITMQYFSFSITLVFGMSQAVMVRVGHAVGRQDTSGIRYAAYIGMFINFCFISLIAISYYLIPRLFLSLDVSLYAANNTRLIQDASLLLSISGVMLIFDNFRIIGFGALRGMKDVRFPMYASFVGFWLVGLSAAFLLAFVFNYGGAGIWWGLVLGVSSGAILVLVRLSYLLSRRSSTHKITIST